MHFYVRNTRPESDVYTELKVSILCDEEEVAQEVILPGESAVVTTMLTEKEKEYTCKAEPGRRMRQRFWMKWLVSRNKKTRKTVDFSGSLTVLKKIRSVKEKYLTAALFSDTITQVVVK